MRMLKSDCVRTKLCWEQSDQRHNPNRRIAAPVDYLVVEATRERLLQRPAEGPLEHILDVRKLGWHRKPARPEAQAHRPKRAG